MQSRRCYETVRRHGRQVIAMEPVKGGTLAQVPADVEALLRSPADGRSPVDWALLFCAGLDGVFSVLSGMSSLEQMEQNIRCLNSASALSAGELELLAEAARMMDGNMRFRLTEPEKYAAVCPEGIPVAELLRYYNEATQEIAPDFSSELNYYGNLRDRSERVSRCTGCGREVMLPRKKAEKALKKIISPADQAGEDRRNPYAL